MLFHYTIYRCCVHRPLSDVHTRSGRLYTTYSFLLGDCDMRRFIALRGERNARLLQSLLALMERYDERYRHDPWVLDHLPVRNAASF